MDRDEIDFGWVITSCISMCILAFVIGLYCGKYTYQNEVRNEAVKLGHAEWVPDESSITFQWKPQRDLKE